MEKFPIKKVNQMRKVASAAIHIASMDIAHAALKPEDHTAKINKKPETEIAQVQQNSAEPQNILAEKLKNTTGDYFKQEVNRTNKGELQSFDTSHYKDLRRSDNIEDRRNDTLITEIKREVTDTLSAISKDLKHPFTSRVSVLENGMTAKDSVLAKQAGADDIEKAAKNIHTEHEIEKKAELEQTRKRLEEYNQKIDAQIEEKRIHEQAQTEEQYEEYRKTAEKIDHTWDTKEKR